MRPEDLRPGLERQTEHMVHWKEEALIKPVLMYSKVKKKTFWHARGFQ